MKFFIGTSGWSYRHWGEGCFYPEKLSTAKQFAFYSQQFNTVEINYSFYHQPTEKTYKKWQEQAPKDFLYSIKAHRMITHIRRLKDVEEPWKKVEDGVTLLKEKLGPVLIQCPPSFHKDLNRLELFAKTVEKAPFRLAIEFRHASWMDKEAEDFLRKKNWAWVISSIPKLPLFRAVTADFIYVRFHGTKEMFASSYSDCELKEWAEWLKSQKVKRVYAYFNNDAEGFAPKNARILKNFLP